MTTLITFIQRAIMQGIPLLYGSTGEILTEKSGNLNLGIPGIMYVGGISGVIGAFLYEESMGANDLNPFLAVFTWLLEAMGKDTKTRWAPTERPEGHQRWGQGRQCSAVES